MGHCNRSSPATETKLTEMPRPVSCPVGVQVESHVKRRGDDIMGLYVANERLGDLAVPLGLGQAAESIRRENPSALVLVVSSHLSPSIRVSGSDKRSFSQIDNDALNSDASPFRVCRNLPPSHELVLVFTPLSLRLSSSISPTSRRRRRPGLLPR